MKIAGLSAVFPSRVVSNDAILDLIAKESAASFQGNLQRCLRRVRRLLNHSEIQCRRWTAEHENPFELLRKAVQNATQEAQCELADVDLLVYTGVGGGFIEPGNCYMLAQSLGMKTVHCFDVQDACNGWTRALQIAHCFLQSNIYRRILIVNAEFNMEYGGPIFPEVFKLKTAEEIEWKLPAFTVGEAATATILERDSDREWEFHFSSRCDLADLCTVPRRGFDRFCDDSMEASRLQRIGRNGPNLFTSYGSDLFSEGFHEAISIFENLRHHLPELRLVFPHTASKRLWDDMGAALGIQHLIFHIYPEFGNVVSASVPSAIDLARRKGIVRGGDRLASWVGSAGMSFSAVTFVL